MGFYSELDLTPRTSDDDILDRRDGLNPLIGKVWTCLGCGAPGYPSACPSCVGESFDPPAPPTEESDTNPLT